MRARQLEVFCAVMRAGTVTAAARELNISQPALSQILLHTEDELGFALFERAKGRLIPTEAAKELLPEALRLFAGLEAMRRRTDDLRQGRAGVVRLAASPPPAMKLVPDALTRFRANHPDITIRSLVAPLDLLVPMVDQGDAEMALAMDDTPRRGFDIETLAEVGMVCLVAENDELAGAGPLTLADLKGRPLISYRHDTRPARELARMCAAIGQPYRPDIEIDVSLSAIAFVQQGLGVAVIDALLPWDQFKGLIARPLAIDFKLPVALITRSDRAFSPAHEQLRLYLREAAARLNI
ncbi:MAG: LysR family transcriptional regulator [Proteobacteria bacterium]|nr:LysR family transcriptional regulator [Pseudomonadota bacterium]